MHDERPSADDCERALGTHAGVRRVVTTTETAPDGATQRIAYVEPHPGHALSTRELMQYACERLPERALPTSIVLRDVLPASDDSPGHDRAGIESLLCDIWQQVLEVPHVDVRDDFFELGGHSLTAGQVMTRLRERLQVDLPLRALFEAPTVEALAESVEDYQRLGDASRDS